MATFRSKMKYLDDNWADRIWEESGKMNDGRGAAWRLALAALAVTGARPASLEKGIVFDMFYRDGIQYIRATVPGAKILENPDGTPRRGQKFTELFWRSSLPAEFPFRAQEFVEIARALTQELRKTGEGASLKISYDRDSIATNIRDLSKRIWPRRTHHVSPICYREAFSSEAKAAGESPERLAAAMGHLSAESQGKYLSGRHRRSSGAVAPSRVFSKVRPASPIKTERAPMARFKAMNSLKAAMKRKMRPAS